MRSKNFTDEYLVSEHLINLSIESHSFDGASFKVGDRVRATSDVDEDGISRGDEGVVVGFRCRPAAKVGDRTYKFRKEHGTDGEQWFMFVEFENCEPIDVDPSALQVIE